MSASKGITAEEKQQYQGLQHMCTVWKKEYNITMKLNRPVSMVDTDHAGFHVSGWKSLIDRHSLQHNQHLSTNQHILRAPKKSTLYIF